MNEYLSFELEVPNVETAKKRVAEVQKAFGEDVYITVNIVGEDKSKVLSTLDDAIKDTAAKLIEKISKHKEED